MIYKGYRMMYKCWVEGGRERVEERPIDSTIRQ